MPVTLPENSKMLDKQFIFGVATSAYQIEGAVSRDGRVPSIWDTFCRKPGAVAGGENGDIACNHYDQWEQDIDLIRSLHVDAYRLSVSWPRIILDKKGTVNEKGLRFYENILDKLNEAEIKPFVTLYHWDLPQYLEDSGGWLSRDTAHAFAHYADIVSNRFKNKIHSYTTLNEPWCSAVLGYGLGIHAPGKKGKKNSFTAAHHLLLAHGLAMEVLRKNAPEANHGIVLNFTPAYPLKETTEDKKAADIANQESGDWYLKPILEGKYPDIILETFEKDMPDIHSGDMDIISSDIDYLGLNYYTRQVVSKPGITCTDPYEHVTLKGVERTDIGWEIFPQGLYDLILNQHNRYRLPPIFITENGAACADNPESGKIHDEMRVNYLSSHLNTVDRLLNEGVDIRGYFAWSLMDNFEWAEGYSKRFGMIYTDYSSQNRTLKESARAYQSLLKNRKR